MDDESLSLDDCINKAKLLKEPAIQKYLEDYRDLLEKRYRELREERNRLEDEMRNRDLYRFDLERYMRR